MLDIHRLVKEYKRGRRANDGVSLRLERGEVLGLLGHNGAGKTTLINQVVGLVKPTSGSIRMDGHDLVADPAFARAACALMPQAETPIDGVTPRQAIEMLGRIRGAAKRHARDRTAELISALDIEPWADTVAERLSGGVRRLTAFAMAAVEPGRLVMLDEPTNDVDPVRRRLLWRQIRVLAERGHAVLLVTHNVVEAQRSVDRLVVLDNGRVVAEGTPTQMRSKAPGDLRLELLTADAREITPEIETVGPVLRGERRHLLPISAATAQRALSWAQRLQDQGAVEEFSLTPISLEDVYVGLVGNGSEATSNTQRSEKGSGNALVP